VLFCLPLDRVGVVVYNYNMNTQNTHQKLWSFRQKKIITTSEYAVLYNFFFGNFKDFKKDYNIKFLRELYKSGMTKIKRSI